MQTATILYIVLAVIVALAIAAFQYFYKVKKRSKNVILLAFLRFLSLFLLFFLLINPKIESTSTEVEKPKLVVLTDNSASVKHLKSDTKLVESLNTIKSNKKLSEKYDLNYFSFTDDISEDSLSFKASKTNIYKSLNSVKNLYKKDKNVSVLLLTDGNQTEGQDYSYFKSDLEINPVVVGDTTQYNDLKLSKLNVNKYSFLNNEFPVEVFVNYSGDKPIQTNFVVSNGTNVLYKQLISLSETKNSASINFNLKATRVGVLNYRAYVTPIENEINKINNQINFSVRVVDEQSKIAIVSDILHPDLGVLKRSIESNKQRKAEILKPNSGIKLNDYQLFILYQPNNSFNSIFNQLNAQKKNYLVISGTKTDWNFLNKAQAYFSKNHINQTEEYFAVTNTNYPSFVLDEVNFQDFSPLRAKYGDLSIKPAHEVLFYQSINGIETNKPLLATFTDGNLKSGILQGENIWKWRSQTFLKSKNYQDFDAFISNLVQYLSQNKKLSRLDIEYKPTVFQNDDVIIKATYFDTNYNVDTRTNLNLTLKNLKNDKVTKLPLAPNQNSFLARINDLESGDYQFTVASENGKEKKSGAFKVLDYNVEQQFSFADVNKLKNLNSDIYHVNKIDDLLSRLINDTTKKPIQKSTVKQTPIIDWKWLLALIAVFLSLEWFLRKYFGKI